MSRRSRPTLILAASALAVSAGAAMLVTPEAAVADPIEERGASEPAAEPARPADPDEPGIEDPEAIGACDASAGGEADVAELVEDAPVDRTIETPMPTRWRASRGRQCRRYHGRAFCDGPRRVPEPHGPAAELARRIGLDDERRVGRVALNAAPEPEWLAAVDGEMGAGMLWPVPEGRIWRGFGRHRVLIRRRGGRLRQGRRRRLHRGVDFGAEAGSAIRAVNDGLVLYSQNGMRGYGNSVVLLHADGSVTLYAHCRATYVFAGQQVERGQVIGEVGHTGLAHGDHLHFEWRVAGRPRDPMPHFVGAPGDEETAPATPRAASEVASRPPPT